MSSHDIAELTWENGQLAMHGLGGIFAPRKGPTWDTLESVVHQATITNKETGPDPAAQHGGSVVASSGQKRTRSESDYQHCQMKLRDEEDWLDMSVCASANAAFCRENGRAMSTWAASHESSRSTRTKTTDENSACQGGSEIHLEGRHGQPETHGRSNSARKGRAAAVHNQSERKRRDRINQKMKALQKLVPNANKTDKASMLDEVIQYLKQLQAQVQLMGARSMPQHMMMPLGMQQQLQMSILARAGMGVGLGMGMPHHQLGSFVPQASPGPGNTGMVPFDQYNAFFNQSMNMDMYSRMAALYGQQMNQSTKTSSHT